MVDFEKIETFKKFSPLSLQKLLKNGVHFFFRLIEILKR